MKDKKSSRLSKSFECYIDRILRTSYEVNKTEFFTSFTDWKNYVVMHLQLKGFYIAICRKVLKSVIDNLYLVCYDLRGLTLSMDFDTWSKRVSQLLNERGVKKC